MERRKGTGRPSGTSWRRFAASGSIRRPCGESTSSQTIPSRRSRNYELGIQRNSEFGILARIQNSKFSILNFSIALTIVFRRERPRDRLLTVDRRASVHEHAGRLREDGRDAVALGSQPAA